MQRPSAGQARPAYASRRQALAALGGLGAAAAAGFGAARPVAAQLPAGPIFDVRKFGASGNGTADDASAIQFALEAAGVNGGGVVAVPAGTYRTTKPLRLHDNTTLQMAVSATLLRDFPIQDTWGATVGNYDQWYDGNQNIGVTGGTIRAIGPSAVGKHLGFRKVRNLYLDDIRFTGVHADWNVALMDVTNAVAHGLVMRSGRGITEDGIHVAGGRFITISGCDITCGDDAVSIAHEFPGMPDIEDVTVENCRIHSIRANAIRILSTTDREVRRVALRGITGSVDASHGLLVEDSSGRGLVHDVSVQGLALDLSKSAATGVRINGARNVRLSDVSLGKTLGRPFHIANSLGVTLARCDGSPGLPGMQAVLAEYSFDVTLDRFTCAGATQHGLVLSNIGGGAVQGCTVAHAANAGLQVDSCTGVRVSDCRMTENTWGIQLDGASDHNHFLNNDLGNNRLGAVTGQPGEHDFWLAAGAPRPGE